VRPGIYISQLQESGQYDEALLSDFNRRYQRQINRLTPNLENHASSALDPTEQQSRKLLLELLEIERRILHELRSRGELYEDVYHRLGEELDLEALRVRRNMRPV
jgi:hypothetical protein